MASEQPNGDSVDVEADFAKALKELAKGEITATALENQLNAMEAKIDALLEQAEKEQKEIESGSNATSSSNGSGSGDAK